MEDTVSAVHNLGIQVDPKLAALSLVSVLKNGLPASGGSIFTTIQKTGVVTYSLEVQNVGVAPTAPLKPAASEFAVSTGFSVAFLASSFPSLAPGESVVVQVGNRQWEFVCSCWSLGSGLPHGCCFTPENE